MTIYADKLNGGNKREEYIHTDPNADAVRKNDRILGWSPITRYKSCELFARN